MNDNLDNENFDFYVHKKHSRIITYYTDNIIDVTIEAIINAENTIKVNMAYLKNEDILSLLIQKAIKGVDIEMIISNTDTNKGLYHRYNDLIGSGVSLYQFGTDNWWEGIMHRKSVVIDNELLLTGSYNWTNNSNNNQEELFVIEDNSIISEVLLKFEDLKLKSHRLNYQKQKLGMSVKFRKNKKVEIEKWWYNLDYSWKEFFKNEFSLDDKPSVEDLIKLTNCEHLSIKFNDTINSVKPLEIFKNLNYLVIYHCKEINDLAPLSNLLKLEYLDIACTSVTDLSPIEKLKNLKELNISNTLVADLDPINNLDLNRIVIINLNLFQFLGKRPKYFTLHPKCKINFDD